MTEGRAHLLADFNPLSFMMLCFQPQLTTVMASARVQMLRVVLPGLEIVVRVYWAFLSLARKL